MKVVMRNTKRMRERQVMRYILILIMGLIILIPAILVQSKSSYCISMGKSYSIEEINQMTLRWVFDRSLKRSMPDREMVHGHSDYKEFYDDPSLEYYSLNNGKSWLASNGHPNTYYVTHIVYNNNIKSDGSKIHIIIGSNRCGEILEDSARKMNDVSYQIFKSIKHSITGAK